MEIRRQEDTPPDFTIENMTITACLAGPIDLDEVAASLADARFEPEKIVCVNLKVRNPKATLSIFGSGKIVCLGVRSYEDGKRAINEFVERMRRLHNLEGTRLKGRPVLHNLSATVDFGRALDLYELNTQFEGSVYMPETNPSLTVRMNGSATALLFGSGKVVFTGVDSVEKMRDFVTLLWEKVHEFSEGANIAQDGPS